MSLTPVPLAPIPPDPIIEVSPKFKKAVLPYVPQIAALLPHAVRHTYKGQDSLIVDHEADITLLARNLNITLPTPIEARYDWANGNPFHVQRVTAALLTMFPRSYVLNGMGTGKTRAALWAYDFLRREGKVNSMLVAAPLSTLDRTWAAEIFRNTPHLRFMILHGDKQRRLKRLAEKADIYIVNHHGTAVLLEELMARTDIDVICLDELATYRNGQTALNKVMRKVAGARKWVWGMTGSPIPKSPTNAWGQAKIVTPNTTTMTYRNFRERVQYQVAPHKYVNAPNALDIVHALMQPAVRFTLDDVTELPEIVIRDIEVTQSHQQTLAYDILRKHMFLMMQNQQITVANAGVLSGKLLQVSAGWVYDNERNTISLNPADRLQTTLDIIESTDNKVLVFVPFIHALDGVASFLAANGVSVEVVSGATPIGKRNQIFRMFQDTPAPKALVAHPQCMAHGLTLTAADTIIWYAPTTSPEIFEQANARIRRVGQRHRQQIIMLRGTRAEQTIYGGLREMSNVQNMLLDMFAAQNPLF